MTNAPSDDRRALLQSALQAIDDLQAQLDEARRGPVASIGREPIAIVGMSCRFPGGATSPEAYWELLRTGRDVVGEYPAQRRAMAEAAGADLGALSEDTKWYGGFLDEIDQFDPQFFGISPREAATMDPQQRLVLEVGWEALERAGIAPDSLNGSATGVFIGITSNEYIQLAKLSGPASLDVYSATGGALNAAPGRVSYTLGLQGPSMAIDTACSSSLVALHQACQSLRAGETDMALAGGVNLLLLPEAFICFDAWGMMASDGRCKTFDAAADGFVRGEGCGIVVLKRLSDAVSAGDQVLAVVRGSAVNQDGRSSGLTVPNGPAQQAVLTQALANAGVDPADVQYFEAHGTGTTLGDPIEIEAMGAVLGRGRPADRAVIVGSVKTNIGHLESASGIAGLIKVVLAMQHGMIPPNLHFHEPSAQIPWPKFPVVVPTELTPWPATGGHRLAGVSGFGFSGTNAHVVIESAPGENAVPPPPAEIATTRVLALSARNDAALAEMAAQYATWIAARPELSLADACATVNTGRATLPQRVAVVASSPAELVDRLNAFAADGSAATGVVTGRARRPRVAFLFTGQGAQYTGMARGLYDTEPVFRDALDRCAALMDPLLPEPLLAVLFAGEGTPAAELLGHTGFTQPALFAVEHSLCELWRSWGIVAEAMLGHSIGELVAATEAGVFSLEDATRLIVARGALMQALPDGGAMVAVDATLADVEPVIAGFADLAVAAINGPAHTVVSGGGESVAAVSAGLAGRGLRVRPLTVSHAFHSPLMLPMLDDFRRVAESVTYRAPQRRLVSNVTGAPAGPEVATADYWVRHVMAPVRFSDGIAALRDAGIDTFVEIGPHPVLTAMGQVCVPGAEVAWAPSLRRKRPDSEQILTSLGQLFAIGARVDWRAVRADGHRRTMPTYPFQRQRHWLDPAPRAGRTITGGHPLLGATITAPLLGATIHEAVVAHDSPPWLGDHRLSATVVFPATAYTEMVLAATATATAGEVESLSILEPLIVPDDGDVTVQTVVTERDGQRDVQILSLGGGAAPYTVHARAVVRTMTASDVPGTVDVDGFAGEFTDAVDVGEYYDHLQSIGLTYGPTFRGLTALMRRDGAAAGLVELPADVRDSATMVLHPALFDACFHVLGVAVAPLDRSASDDMFVPVSIQGLRVHRRGASAAWCVVTILDDDTPLASRAVCVAQLQLYGTDGSPIATVDRLEVRRTPKSIWQRGLGVGRDPVYELTWRGEQGRDAPATPSREWLIVADAAGAGDALAAALEAGGARCTVIAASTAVAGLDGAIGAALQRTESPVGVVHLRALDIADIATIRSSDLEHALGSALTVAQALAAHPTVNASLFIVTRGAQSVEGESPVVAASTLWGLGRVVANEQPHLACRCIDLDPRGEAAVEDLAAELLQAGAEDQIAYRGRHRLVARLAAVAARGATAHVTLDAPYELALSERSSLDALHFVALQRRIPVAGEVEIEVRASGVNFRDVLNALGMYPGDPGAPGMECAGVVTAVGPDVRSVAIGDAVVGIAPGAFASHVVTRADLVVALPAGLGFADAASIPVAFMTAAYGLRHLARLQPGERVLIHAAAGGVGMAAVQIAQRLGAEVYATVGSAEKRDVLERLGVRHIHNSRTLDFAAEILADTGGAGVDVVLNSLSDDFVTASFDALAANGRFLEIGKRGIWSPERAAAERPHGSYHAYDLADLVTDTSAFQTLLRTVVDDIGAGQATTLPVRAFPADEIEHAFRFMAQARHVGKVVVTHRPDAPHVRSDGAYLVTGGLGGIGLAVAGWLVEQGARHLTLAGRSAPSPDASSAIDALRATGAIVQTIQVDISDPGGVERVIATATGQGAALRGVFHAAGITDDGALGQQTWARFQRVLAPKLDGAALLDEATRALDLDHFVLFSSGSAILGAPGQSAYAAANNALDAIAHRRRAAGLPALSINWGAWADAGMAARLDDRHKQRLAERGIGAIPAAEALAVMDRLLGQSAAQVAVLTVDWPVMLAALDRVPPLLADMARAPIGAPAPARASSRRLTDELVAVEAVQRGALLHAAVAAQVVTVLGLDPRETIDGRQGLSDLGMDSLMAVELSNRLSALLDRSLPSTVSFEHPTLDELAAHIQELLSRDIDFAATTTSETNSTMLLHQPLLDMSTIDVKDALLRELDDAGY